MHGTPSAANTHRWNHKDASERYHCVAVGSWGVKGIYMVKWHVARRGKSRSMGCARHQLRMHFLLNIPSASIDLLLLCSQDVPSAISTAVEAPGLEEPDPLQEAVDPKLLVSSRSKGPPRRHHHLTHMPSGGRVDVQHIVCAWCEHADSVDTHTLCAETLCVSTASTGDGAGRRQESSFCFADCQVVPTPLNPTGIYTFWKN